MDFAATPLTDAIEQALVAWAADKNSPPTSVLRPILHTNDQRGRVRNYLHHKGHRCVQDYLQRVAEHYQTWQPLLYELQIERSAAAWEPLYVRLQRIAFNYLLRKNWLANRETARHATDIATDAATVLINAHFPYDVDFDPWVHVLAINIGRRHIRHLMRSSVVPREDLSALETWAVGIEARQRHRQQASERALERRLHDAIARLSCETHRMVIWLRFYEGYEPPEIAEILGKTVNAVYMVQHRALQNLRRLLTEDDSIELIN